MRVNKMAKYRYLRLLQNYLNEYQEKYPKDAIEFIKNNFLNNYDTKCDPDILIQLYANFGIIPPEENYYLNFAKMIGDKYGWNCQILEIGGGFFPAFSYHISQLQKVKQQGGSITVYDPLLVTTSLENIALHKEKFTEETDISSFDVLVGIMPCEATRLIIKKAIKDHKQFFIAMCGCTHYHDDEIPHNFWGPIFPNYQDWVNTVLKLALEQEHDNFNVTIEQKSKIYSYPIISSKKI